MLAYVYETKDYPYTGEGSITCKFNVRGQVVLALLAKYKEDDKHSIHLAHQLTKDAQPRLYEVLNNLHGRACSLITFNGLSMLDIEHEI